MIYIESHQADDKVCKRFYKPDDSRVSFVQYYVGFVFYITDKQSQMSVYLLFTHKERAIIPFLTKGMTYFIFRRSIHQSYDSYWSQECITPMQHPVVIRECISIEYTTLYIYQYYI